MRPIILICLLVISGYIANAQFSVLPQVGFENSRTSIQYNEHSSFSPLGASFSPQAAIRLDYKNKQGNGPYVGIGTSRSIVKFNFQDPQTGMNSYTASKGNMQLRLEGGYQVSTRPFYFKRSGVSNTSSKVYSQKNTERKSCGNYAARSGCGSKQKSSTAAKSASKGSWVRIQPSLGIAYIPFTPSAEINSKSAGTQTSYAYNAGNLKTALISGVGFEFGNNEQRKFVLSINHVMGMGNNDEKSITTTSFNKPTVTSLKSDASSWNLRMGIPISFTKKKPVAAKQEMIKRTYNNESKCGQYRCGEYKLKCRKVI